MVKVSIIVPAYNVEKYVERCVNSILSNSLEDIEIIIINDGSTDKTLDILNSIKSKDSRVIVMNRKNGGMSSARNLGIKNASGKYILFVDSDDWIKEDCLEKLYEMAEKNNFDIVNFKIYITDDKKKKKCNMKNYNCMDGYNFRKEILLNNISPNVVSKLIKRECILNTKFNEGIRYAEDLYFNIQLSYNLHKIGFLNDYLYFYYQNKKSITKSNKYLFDLLDAFKLINAKLKLCGELEDEFEFCRYLHVYINKIILNQNLDKNHKKLYSIFINEKSKIKNKYIIQYDRNCSLNIKILNNIYNYNYYLGAIASKALYLIKNILQN